jgi:post-GPI attachment to proteins factor 3
VFHTRDLLWTERMDYFGAGANVLYGLFLAPVRVFEGYYPPKKRAGSSLAKTHTSEFKPWVYIWATLCAAGYIAHIYYLSFVEWSYTYNMMANVIAGATGNLLWSYFSVQQYRKKGNARNLWPGLCVMWIIAAMGLELLDFPPIAGVLDAHSLWHLMTVWPTMWWYVFLLADARDVLGYGDAGEDLGVLGDEAEMVRWKDREE